MARASLDILPASGKALESSAIRERERNTWSRVQVNTLSHLSSTASRRRFLPHPREHDVSPSRPRVRCGMNPAIGGAGLFVSFSARPANPAPRTRRSSWRRPSPTVSTVWGSSGTKAEFLLTQSQIGEVPGSGQSRVSRNGGGTEWRHAEWISRTFRAVRQAPGPTLDPAAG